MDNPAFTEISGETYENVRKNEDTDSSGSVVAEPSSGSVVAEPEIVTEKVKLKKTVGLVSGTSLIVGTIIGSGIFVSPTDVLDRTGSVGMSLLVWSLSGLLALLGSLSYAELGTLIQKSGGEYAYFKEAFGDIPAFLFAWTSVIVLRTSSMAIICLTFAQYTSSLFPYCGSPEITVKLVAITVIITLAMVNSYDTRLAARIQVFFTLTKLLSLGVIIVGGIVRLSQGYTSEFNNSFKGTTSSPSYIALAFYNALWAYDGWNNLNYVTEEIENPEKNLPRANILGVLLVTVVYIFTNISYLTAMTSAELLASSAVAVTWGERVIGSAAIIMTLSVMFSTFGAANGTIFTGGRVVYAAGREGHLPEFLSYVHVKQYTPMPSMLFTAVIAVCMVIPGNIGSLIDFFSFTAWLFYGGTVTSLIVFRFTKKDAKRPIKIPIVIPIIFVLIAIYLVIGPIIESPQIEFLYAFLFVIGGLIFYIPFVVFKVHFACFDWITIALQLLFEIAPSPYEPTD